jgi:hypothetical protein
VPDTARDTVARPEGSRMRGFAVAGCHLALLALGCAEPKPLPNVVEPKPGQTLTSLPGPMPNFGPFATVDEGLLAACPLVLSQPHAVIPVRPDDQNFKLYWRIAREYCAWFYAPEGQGIVMSLLAVNAVDDDPKKRQCLPPSYVVDSRYPASRIAYLVIVHSHAFDETLNKFDLGLLVEMAQLHGFTSSVQGKETPISIVAFIGEEHDDKVTCTGFYQYTPHPSSELVSVTIDKKTGALTRTVLNHVKWKADMTYELLP